MPRIVSLTSHKHVRCLRARQLQHVSSIGKTQPRRAFSYSSPHYRTTPREVDIDDVRSPPQQPPTSHNGLPPSSQKEQGAMSRRLEAATEDALFEGGRAGRRAVEDAGFSEELKSQLLDKLKGAEFNNKFAASITEASIPSYGGRASRDIATARPWEGQESTADAVHRMLQDAHKPLKPTLRGKNAAPLVDLRLQPRVRQSPGERLAAAREKSSNYDLSKDPNLSEKEREELRNGIKERYGSAAVRGGAMPNSFRGLEGLANERIEDAIARGQFKDIPRGQGALDLTRHGNPFIDTTEYLLNNMIKRQEIVPPWIEKQQEVISTAENFRMRIRVEWKRHAVRTISSQGGSLEEQIRRAELYGASEAKFNPRKKDVSGTPTQITVGGNPLMQSLVEEVAAAGIESDFSGPDAATAGTDAAAPEPLVSEIGVTPESASADAIITEVGTADSSAPSISPSTPLPLPLRSEDWLKTERSYFELVISQLNSLTRSYNLMAPELAKKPYFSLERELKAMYADVAPQLADEIRYRASQPLTARAASTGKGAGVLEGFTAGHKAKIYDEVKPKYGFKELLQDWFGKKK